MEIEKKWKWKKIEMEMENRRTCNVDGVGWDGMGGSKDIFIHPSCQSFNSNYNYNAANWKANSRILYPVVSIRFDCAIKIQSLIGWMNQNVFDSSTSSHPIHIASPSPCSIFCSIYIHTCQYLQNPKSKIQIPNTKYQALSIKH